MQCIHPRASSQFELTAAELREVDAAIFVVLVGSFLMGLKCNGWMDGWMAPFLSRPHPPHCTRRGHRFDLRSQQKFQQNM